MIRVNELYEECVNLISTDYYIISDMLQLTSLSRAVNADLDFCIEHHQPVLVILHSTQWGAEDIVLPPVCVYVCVFVCMSAP